jgi:hypothetical protein
MEETEQQQQQQQAAQIVPDVPRAVAEQVCLRTFGKSIRYFKLELCLACWSCACWGCASSRFLSEQLHTVHTTQQQAVLITLHLTAACTLLPAAYIKHLNSNFSLA